MPQGMLLLHHGPLPAHLDVIPASCIRSVPGQHHAQHPFHPALLFPLCRTARQVSGNEQTLCHMDNIMIFSIHFNISRLELPTTKSHSDHNLVNLTTPEGGR